MLILENKNTLVTGELFKDHRGILTFVNDFKFPGVKRFYTLTHPDIGIVRAWQGHKTETKHFFVTKGSFLIGWVKPDDWENPSTDLIVNKQILHASEPAILKVEAGHANGLRALEKDSILMVFSDLDLDQSTADTFRFAAEQWKL